MHIDQVTLTTDDPDGGARFYRDVLGLPVARDADGAGSVEVILGRSTLVLRDGVAIPAGRAHHLAFDVADARFDAALEWVGERTEVITKDGTTVIAGPPGWNSRSVYFWGPDGAVLELIARADLDLPSTGTGAFDPGEILHISEVALGVSGALAVARGLEQSAGLAPFTPVTDEFLPVGDQLGLLILTDVERTLVPTESTRIAVAPVEVTLREPHPATVHPTEQSVVVAV